MAINQREEDKNSGFFSRVMDLTSQTLLADFAVFVEILPPISVYSLSHLKCTMLGEGTQIKNKMRFIVKTEEPYLGLLWSWLLSVAIICPS